jgi:hypothetical protein
MRMFLFYKITIDSGFERNNWKVCCNGKVCGGKDMLQHNMCYSRRCVATIGVWQQHMCCNIGMLQ